MILATSVLALGPVQLPRIESVSVNRFNDVTLNVKHNGNFVIWLSTNNVSWHPLGIAYVRPGEDTFSIRWQDMQLKHPSGYFVVTPVRSVE